MIDKNTVVKNFSKCAPSYDQYAAIQRFAAEQLIEEIPEEKFADILELGCGSGIYTRLLAGRFNNSNIRAIDISAEMIRAANQKIQAVNVDFAVEDAQNLPPGKEYDLITSNSALHWFESIEKGIAAQAKSLKKGARIIFSTFGPLTFNELGAALGKVRARGDFFVASRDFWGKEKLQNALGGFFRQVSVKEILVKKEFPGLVDLLKEIKYTGCRGYAAENNHIWTRGLLYAIEDAYLKNYGRIVATYQLFLCKAVNPISMCHCEERQGRSNL